MHYFALAFGSFRKKNVLIVIDTGTFLFQNIYLELFDIDARVHAKLLQLCQLFVTLWTIACQTPLSTGFLRQEYWSGLLSPSPGDLPDPGIEPASLMSLALAGRFFITSTDWRPWLLI